MPNIQSVIDIDETAVQTFLLHYYNGAVQDVTLVGAGAWSRCFGFTHNNTPLVIRFGKYIDDFENDAQAFGYASPALPIPEVRDIGNYADGYYAISTRVFGTPLEQVSPVQWQAIVPSLIDVLEAIRTADIVDTAGFGGWGKDGNAPEKTWADHLLTVHQDIPEMRTHGWRRKLAEMSPEGNAAFDWGYDLLKSILPLAVSRNLLHCDLINRNVLVQNEQISGVFDWGCSRYGDHLYELAWFEFWEPWLPQLDVSYLRAELEKRWQADGYQPHNQENRLMACYLHIGLDHLAYNTYIEDWQTLLETAVQMKRLVNHSHTQN